MVVMVELALCRRNKTNEWVVHGFEKRPRRPDIRTGGQVVSNSVCRYETVSPTWRVDWIPPGMAPAACQAIDRRELTFRELEWGIFISPCYATLRRMGENTRCASRGISQHARGMAVDSA